jgi:glutathione S-transferase
MSTQTTIQIHSDYGSVLLHHLICNYHILTLPSYVLLTTSLTYLLSIWLGVRVGPFRNAAHVPHPSVSADVTTAKTPEHKRAIYLFNCAQRAHYNFLENYPAALSGMLISGLRWPELVSAMGVVWILGRVVYAVGYTSKGEGNVEGKGRWMGGGFYMAAVTQVGFMVGVGKLGWDLIVG